jgi:hypothetical protein
MALQLFKIASTTVETPQNSITFNSIPQGYTDLKLVISVRANSGTPGVVIELNGSGSSFTWRYLEGDGASATSVNGSAFGVVATANSATATASTFASAEIYIPNYASSNYKSISSDSVTENNATTAYADFFANLWSNTAAINQVTLKCGTGTGQFVAGSTATLYGVL